MKPGPFQIKNFTGMGVRGWEAMHPGPYMLEGFELMPQEREYHGMKPGDYYQYTPNQWALLERIRRKEIKSLSELRSMDEVFVRPTQWHDRMVGCWDEWRSHFGGAHGEAPHVKLYILDTTGFRIMVDSVTLERSRAPVFATR